MKEYACHHDSFKNAQITSPLEKSDLPILPKVHKSLIQVTQQRELITPVPDSA